MRHVDQIIETLEKLYPTVKVEQLSVRHPGADDNGVWFFAQPHSEFEVQIESPDGMCPFLVETDEHNKRITTASVEATVQSISELLHLAGGAA